MEERTCFNCAHYDLCYRRRKMEEVATSGINIDGEELQGTRSGLFRTLAGACLDYKSTVMQTVEGNDLKYKVTQLRGALISIVQYWNSPQSADLSISDHVDHMVNIADKALKEIPE